MLNFVKTLKIAPTEQSLSELFCVESEGVVENIPERKYGERLNTDENGSGGTPNLVSLTLFILLSFFRRNACVFFPPSFTCYLLEAYLFFFIRT